MGQLKIVCAQLGPIDTNTYILMDDEIKEAIIIDPDEVIVYPGHGPSTTIGEERETNPFVER